MPYALWRAWHIGAPIYHACSSAHGILEMQRTCGHRTHGRSGLRLQAGLYALRCRSVGRSAWVAAVIAPLRWTFHPLAIHKTKDTSGIRACNFRFQRKFVRNACEQAMLDTSSCSKTCSPDVNHQDPTGGPRKSGVLGIKLSR